LIAKLVVFEAEKGQKKKINLVVDSFKFQLNFWLAHALSRVH
jgi:hypothetical protein